MTYKHKVKPFADKLRAQLAEIPVLQARAMVFDEWTPCARFYAWTGMKTGRFFAVRHYKGKTFVLRLE